MPNLCLHYKIHEHFLFPYLPERVLREPEYDELRLLEPYEL